MTGARRSLFSVCSGRLLLGVGQRQARGVFLVILAAALAPPRLPASAQSALAAYRPLVERWLAHVGDLAAQARARGLAPALVLERFTAPGAITQRPLSLIEVELQLDLPAVLVPGTAPQT